MRLDPIISLSKQLRSKIIIEPKLSDYSWWKIGGLARGLIDIETLEDLMLAITFLKSTGIPYCVIGEGTNILFDDKGFDGCIIKIGRKFSDFEFSGNKCSVDAGHWIPSLVIKIAKIGFSGLEHAIGIPASLGGLVLMNGGSNRKNISEYIRSVVILDKNVSLRVDEKIDCGFGYRMSRYQKSSDIVVKVNFTFKEKENYNRQRRKMLKILKERNSKFPRKLPSCGSVFKSTPELYNIYGPPGKVIEDFGFKGLRRGNVQVSPLHANFIVNLGGGSSKDILLLVKDIHKKVYEKTNIRLNTEFLYLHPTCGTSNSFNEIFN